MDLIVNFVDSHYSTFLDVLTSITDLCVMNNDAFIFIDILKSMPKHLILKHGLPSLLNGLGIVSTCSVLKRERITDASTVLPGDIIFTPDNQYVIIQQVNEIPETNTKDRLTVEIIHESKEGFLAFGIIKQDTFVFSGNDSCGICKGNSYPHAIIAFEKETILNRALSLVGSMYVSSRINLFDMLEILKPVECNPKQITASMTPGDIISFSHKGISQKGIVSDIKITPNNMLSFSCFCLSEDGHVITKKRVDNLDNIDLFRCSSEMGNLDACQRDRILYSAQCTLGKRISYRCFPRYQSYDFIKECFTGELAKSKGILIKIDELKLQMEAFPRILNVIKWMKKNDCFDIPESIQDRIPGIILTPTVYVISNTGSGIKHIEVLDKRHVTKCQTEVFTSPSRGKQYITNKCNGLRSQLLTSVMCVISCDNNGNMKAQDKALIEFTKSVSTSSTEVLYIVKTDKGHQTNDLRRLASETVQNIIDPTSTKNFAFAKVFYQNDADILKRISAAFESQVNLMVKGQSQQLQNLQEIKQVNGNEVDFKIVEFGKKISQLESFLPDPYKQHIIEVLLQRHPDVKAFSSNDGNMQIFTNEEETVQQYIEDFSNEKLKITFKTWPGSPKISPYHLQQGSNVHQKGCSEEYGTLGMFLRDNEGGIYFTTCAHVIPNNAETFSEGIESAVGKSVFAPKVGHAFSITETLDLSLVKVYENKIQSCRPGIRNTEDELVEGTVSAADDKEKKDMKVYKWGAKTKLTKGLYKGSLCIKKGEKIGSSLHFIQGNINKKEFAQEGDSGSLICFEATGSPQFADETAAFIFVGECKSGEEYLEEGKDSFAAFCYHVSEVSECQIDGQNVDITPHFQTSADNGSIQQGSSLAAASLV